MRDRESSGEKGGGADKINLFKVTIPPGRSGLMGKMSQWWAGEGHGKIS